MIVALASFLLPQLPTVFPHLATAIFYAVAWCIVLLLIAILWATLPWTGRKGVFPKLAVSVVVAFLAIIGTLRSYPYSIASLATATHVNMVCELRHDANDARSAMDELERLAQDNGEIVNIKPNGTLEAYDAASVTGTVVMDCTINVRNLCGAYYRVASPYYRCTAKNLGNTTAHNFAVKLKGATNSITTNPRTLDPEATLEIDVANTYIAIPLGVAITQESKGDYNFTSLYCMIFVPREDPPGVLARQFPVMHPYFADPQPCPQQT